MAKKKVTKKVKAKKEASKSKIFLVRLAGGNPDCAEYLVGRSEKDATKLKEIIRVLCRLVSQKAYRQTQTGEVQEYYKNVPTYEFYTDTYFTEFEADMHRTAILMSRELDSEEDLYINYEKAIESHYAALEQAEIEKAAQAKAQEIQENRATRRAKKKSGDAVAH